MDIPHHTAKSRQDAWKSYWATGNLHSCVTSYEGNYSGVIAGFWGHAFNDSSPSLRVLDLATGNGAVPKLIYELTRGSAEIDAVDASQVAPRWFDPAKHRQVRFHSGVWMEKLPFPDVSFDIVCSQFGIEYADRPAAWVEALRVLRQGGRLHCVVHHRGSVLTDIATQEQAHCVWLLANDGLLRAASRLAPWLVRVRRGEMTPGSTADAETARASFNEVQAALAARIERGGTVDLLLQARYEVQAILSGAQDPARALDHYSGQIQETELRCSELVQCAMTQAEIAGLTDLLQAQRLAARVELRELRQPEGLLAWGLTLQKI